MSQQEIDMQGVQRGIVFTKPQYEWIKKRAKELGVSVSEVVRRVVDEARNDR